MAVSKKLQTLIEQDNQYLFQNYGTRLPACFIKGKGSELFDQDGKRYIDFFAGIAVNSLGYNHPALNSALHKQIDAIMHSSNWFFNKQQIEAAQLLSETSFPGKTLFTNSGTEANEAAIKLARKYGISQSNDKYHIISFTNSFHGRTFGAMSATAQEKIRSGFGPIVPGFIYVPFNDVTQFKKTLEANKGKICAVITELVQGEGGITVADSYFIKEISSLCKENNILLIIDEVQTGIARTGKMFAYQHYDIQPDIISLAKGLGGGVPIGAIHAQNFLVEFFPKGTHGTTFGGNHLAAAAAKTVLEHCKKESLLNNVNTMGKLIVEKLSLMKKKYPTLIIDVRGIGLHIGIELSMAGQPIVVEALKKGLIINCTAEKVIRIMPPLTINKKLVTEGLSILDSIFAGVTA
ncbi:MAG TPA: aspartate aminotransferase family protein [Spirochaetota bacterium]|nr:aspartate aminotransferase family protein [Spirochaetota bacterium]